MGNGPAVPNSQRDRLGKREDMMARATKDDRFSKEIQEKLGHYVYRLIDPRNGQTFYVGKGQGNRVFEHVKAALKTDESSEEDLRLETIRQIKRKNLAPIHVIHRHNMSKNVALEVEAALIEAYPGLTNQISGQGSNDYGTAHVDELIERYAAETIKYDPSHNIMLIKTKWSTVEKRGGIYQAVRARWKINLLRAKRAHYILAIIDGICRGVFKPEKWKPSSPPEDKRYEFDGDEAKKEIRERYVNKRLPDNDCRKGMAAPVLYKYP